MLRKMTQQDIETVNNLGENYIENFSSKFILHDYVDSPVYSCFVYEDEIIKGFYISHVFENEAELELIYVDKMFRKQHIGQKLLENLLQNYKTIILEVSVENNAAINLYKKNNFKEFSIRKGYYNGIDAIMMRRENT